MKISLTNPIFNAYVHSDFFGKAIFIALGLLSIVTWSLFFQKFFALRAVQKKSFLYKKRFLNSHSNPLIQEVSPSSHPFFLLYQTLKQHTLEILNKNRSVLQEQNVYLSANDIVFIEEHLKKTSSKQERIFEKNLFVLSTIVSLAPFLGLLGTVWGILITFGELQSGGVASANATVMGGLAMALATTVLGLLVAIPALIAYNYLRAYLNQFAEEMDLFCHQLLASLELNYRKVDLS